MLYSSIVNTGQEEVSQDIARKPCGGAQYHFPLEVAESRGAPSLQEGQTYGVPRDGTKT